MKFIGLSLAAFSGLFLSVSPTYSHLYDSVGVEAAPHNHHSQPTEAQFENNCFIDPKLGPICK